MAKNPPTDLSLTVATAALVTIYSQGATTTAPATIPNNTTTAVSIPVLHTGYAQGVVQIPGGGTSSGLLYVNGDSGKSLLVVDVIQGVSPAIVVRNTLSTGYDVSAGSRLMVASPTAQFYSDPLGAVGIGASLGADLSTGYVRGYVASLRYDLIITGVTDSPRFLLDLQGGFVMRG